MASALASLVRKYLDRVASRGPAAEFEAFVAPDVTVQEFPSRAADKQGHRSTEGSGS